ncbi:MAG: hypothetical protein ACREQ9_22115 [Candidatus Binatia bacterium]
MRRAAAILTLAFVVLLSPTPGPGRAAELRDLADLDDLRTLVDRDKTIPRLVLLLSPT